MKRLELDKEDALILLKSMNAKAYWEPFNSLEKKKALDMRSKLMKKFDIS